MAIQMLDPNFRFKMHFLGCLLLVGVMTGTEVFAFELASVGTEISYSCGSGPTKTRSTLVYGKRGPVYSLITEFGSSVSLDSDSELWQYLAGLQGRSMEGTLLKVLTLKSGDLNKATDYKVGTQYRGIVSHYDRRSQFDMGVTMAIGKEVREKTALGVLGLVPVTTTITNSDGKGGTATVQVKFSPAMKINVTEKITGFLPERGWDCVATKIRPRKDIDANLQFRFDLPATGAILKYQCDGPVKSREIRVVSNSNGVVKFSVLRDGKPAGDLTSDAWQFYANMAREAILPGNRKIVMNVKGNNELSQLSASSVKPGGYQGVVASTGVDVSEFPVRVAVRPKSNYISKQFGSLTVVPIFSYQGTSAKDVVKTHFLYSEQLKAPVSYSVTERQDTKRNQNCRLVALSGTGEKNQIIEVLREFSTSSS